MTKTTLAILAAAAMFGAVSAAQAGSRNDGAAATGVSRGFRIGPLGQPMGGPMTWRGRPPSVYAYVPRARLDRRWYYQDRYGRPVIW